MTVRIYTVGFSFCINYMKGKYDVFSPIAGGEAVSGVVKST